MRGEADQIKRLKDTSWDQAEFEDCGHGVVVNLNLLCQK